MAATGVEYQQQQQNVAPQQQQPILIDTQHDDMVHDAQMDYYGCKLATASSDRTIKIFDVSESGYTHTATLQNHSTSGPIWEVSWSHPKFGSVLASCSFDGSVLVHRERSPGDWILLSSHPNLHESSVNSVAFGPHEYGLILASASSDGMVSVLTHQEDDSWKVEKFQDNALGVNTVSWGPYCGEEQKGYMRLVTGGCDNKIRFWRKSLSEDGTGIWELDEDYVVLEELRHTDWVRDVAWAPSRVAGETIVGSCSEDGSVIIWTKKDDENTWAPKLLNQFDGPVWRLSWSITGNILAVSSGDGDVTLWKQMLDGGWKRVSSVDDARPGSVQGQQ